MTTEDANRRRPSRRLFLGSVAAGTVSLAGCSSRAGSDPEAPGNGRDNFDDPPEWLPVLGGAEADRSRTVEGTPGLVVGGEGGLSAAMETVNAKLSE